MWAFKGSRGSTHSDTGNRDNRDLTWSLWCFFLNNSKAPDKLHQLHSPGLWRCPVSSAHPGAGGQRSPCVWTGWLASGASAGAGWLYPEWPAHFSWPHSWFSWCGVQALDLEPPSGSSGCALQGVRVQRGQSPLKATEEACVWTAVVRCGLAVGWLCSGCALAVLFVMNVSQQLFSSSGCSSAVDMHFPHNVKISCVSGWGCDHVE